MQNNISTWFKENLRTPKHWAVALTILTPIAMIARAAADYTMSGAAIIFFLNSLIKRDWNWVKKPWIIAALVLWAYCIVRAAFIPHGGSAVFAAFAWIRYIVFAASVIDWTLAEEKERKGLLYSTAFAVAFLACDGLVQYILGYDFFRQPLWTSNRLTGPYTKPILGITIANFFAPAVFWFLERGQIRKSIVLGDVCLAAVFLSGDRMGLLLASFIMIVWLFVMMRQSSKRWQDFGLTVCLFAALVIVAPRLAEFRPHPAGTAEAQPQAVSPVERQFESTAATAEEFSSSPYGRVWGSALHVGEAYPVFGVGMRQFRVVCPDERFGPLNDPKTGVLRCYTHPHNSYLEWFSENGIVGLLGFIAFAGTVAVGIGRRLWANSSQPILWGVAAMLCVRLMPFFVSTSFFNNWSAIPFWLALGWAMSYTPCRKGEVDARSA